MIKNYLKLALRNLFSNKTFSSITIVGFAIGMACVILIALWINDELNYDAFNQNKNSIYRITTHYDKYKWEGLASTPGPLASLAVDEIPEITKAMRVFACPTTIMQIGEKVFYERKGIIADPSVLTMFSFPLIHGDINSVFENKQNILITQKLSNKYFNNENPVGKTIICDGQSFIIDGVLKDIPHNSHLQFDFIVPFEMLGNLPWGNMSFQTYVQLESRANSQIVEDKLTHIAKRNSPQIQEGARFELQPLKDVHLDAKNKRSYTVTGSLNNIYLFTAIAFLVLCIACFNFINLTTAKSESRNKEIGIRKIIGAKKNQLKNQFLVETTLLTFFSLCIAVLLVKLSIPFFNDVVNKELTLTLFDIKMLFILTAVSVITGVIAGAYPAFYLSSLNPLYILKNRFSIISRKNTGAFSTRKVLVILQFSFSIALVISIFCIKHQFDYIKNKDLGFNKEEVIYIPLKSQFAQQYKTFKTELLKQTNIKSVSAQNYLCATTNRRTTNYDWYGKEEGVKVDMLVSQVDFDFFETLQLDIQQGRSFSSDYGTDKQSAFVINEAAVKAMGLENPVGKYFTYNNKKGKIVGIVKDAHLASLHKTIEPQVFHLINNFSSVSNYGVALLRIDMNKANEVISGIKSTYADLCKDAPFEYYFLDQTYDNLYKSEQQAGSIISYFTILAIIISCLGLFGLVSFIATRKNKEIGIRKVNGAKISEILSMLNKDFVKWVAIAFVIATPIAYYAMNKWLENFAYKTELSWWIFALAGVLALGIALLTVSWQSWRAATRNPVEALRYE